MLFRSGLFELGLPTMIIAHVTFQIPFIGIIVRSRLADMDPAVEEAAHDLGADAWQTFRHITLPLMAPGIFAGAALAFTMSIDDFVVSFFTAGPGATTLPILIYSSVKRGITPSRTAWLILPSLKRDDPCWGLGGLLPKVLELGCLHEHDHRN